MSKETQRTWPGNDIQQSCVAHHTLKSLFTLWRRASAINSIGSWRQDTNKETKCQRKAEKSNKSQIERSGDAKANVSEISSLFVLT